MKLIEKLEKSLREKKTKILLRGKVSEDNFAALKMINIQGEPVKLSSSKEEVKVGIQILWKEDGKIIQGNFRVDNSHGYLHIDSISPDGEKIKNSVDCISASGALPLIFGTEYWEMEKRLKEDNLI